MRLFYRCLLFILFPLCSFAQAPGDTIVVRAMDHSAIARDTMVEFPDAGLTYEKIIMEYNLRCKNALISTTEERNKGCGEWDYSCNTYIVDSSRIEKVSKLHPNYIISSFDGENFEYTTEQTYDYYEFTQQNVEFDAPTNVEAFPTYFGDDKADFILKSDEKSGRSFTIYHASDMLNAGLTAGEINAMELWVVNDGGQVDFLHISAKQTAATTLDQANPDMDDFTTLYNSSYTFYSGITTIPFLEAFVWDGVSDIIFQFSFTNSEASTPIELHATSSNEVSSLWSFNNYAVDFSKNGLVEIEQSNLDQIGDEMTIAFWSYGDDVLPANTSILYGYDTEPNNRDLNIHLPWSSGSVFFDCGFDEGYDRISKAAVESNYKGQWNHWAFAKNATAGTMKIYLNGSLWTSSTGATRSINLAKVLLGSNESGGNNYKGKVNKLSFWNKELAASEIADWMNVPITEDHPSYANLMVHFPMTEGIDQNLIDAVTETMATGQNLYWSFERGHTLSRSFAAATVRPNITLLRGDFDQTITDVVVRDSVARTPNSVNLYTITSNEGSLEHDEVNLASNSLLFEATDQIVYDGVTGEVLETIPVEVEGTLTIEDLEYFHRFPFYNQLLSFVTPYGIGIDFGEEGKSWYFDVTDFTPLLKGDKRLAIQLGGQFQEEMDIKFHFIVGTPPRDIVDFRQLWQGTNRTGVATIASINNDTRYAPLDVDMHPEGEYYKLTSTITGHGSDGEFQQNGGEVLHYINIDGGFDENLWNLHRECSENPVYPQGGTWVVDRQGWCPGEPTHTEVLDVTEFVTPGQTSSFDYNCSVPSASGDFRYHIAHQLVTYGPANHQVDVSIVDVKAPSDKVLYSRLNPVCANPIVTIQNTGADEIEEIVFEYWTNQGTQKMTYTWKGKLFFLEEIDITLETGTAFYDVNDSGKNTFHVEVKSVNGAADAYSHNNTYRSTFDLQAVIPDLFIIEARTNNIASENSYVLMDDQGQVILQHALPASNTTYRDTFNLNGCFKLRVTDNGDDGMQWWANPGQGSGSIKIKQLNGVPIKQFESDFGGGFEFNFATESFVSIDDEAWTPNIKIYPNPTSGLFTIKGLEDDQADISLVDMLGRTASVTTRDLSGFKEIDASGLQAGVYFVLITKGSSRVVRKVVVE